MIYYGLISDKTNNILRINHSINLIFSLLCHIFPILKPGSGNNFNLLLFQHKVVTSGSSCFNTCTQQIFHNQTNSSLRLEPPIFEFFLTMEEQECWDFDSESLVFDRDRHILYLQMMYQLLPSPYQGQEINRLTLAYFVISGLDILHALDQVSPLSSISISFPDFEAYFLRECVIRCDLCFLM